MQKIIKLTLLNLFLNVCFAVYNTVLGFTTHSWWFITLGAYFGVLAVTRFALLKIKKKSAGDLALELFAKKFTGVMLIILSVVLCGTVILAAVRERGIFYGEIIMITISVYTVTKITLAVINLVKSKTNNSPVTKTLRNISFCEALVCIFSMQRSMLVSFGEMSAKNILIFNILTGSAVSICVFLLGINLLEGRRTRMAKSKIVKVGKKISDGVTEGYKKIEDGVVKGYTKIEDKFVNMYLTRDGETVEEAKKRLKK